MDALTSTFDVFLSATSSASLGIWNLTGHPAACLKAGFVDGLPQALTITGGPVRRSDCAARRARVRARDEMARDELDEPEKDEDCGCGAGSAGRAEMWEGID
jgi:hypothetical protein